MARPRAFNEEAVLNAAIHCFWSKGYEATSVRDLAQKMGITGASLYNAFGDKRALYERAFTQYVRSTVADRIARLEGRPPLEAIEAFFAEVVARSLSDEERKGCLLVNSALELAPHDEAFRIAIDGVLEQVEGFFRRSVEAGQRDGTIAANDPPEDLARLLLGALMGLRVLSRARPDPELLEGLLRPLFRMLRAAP